MPLTTAYVALGSNLGDRLSRMREALRLLKADGVIVTQTSRVYENRAIGMGDAGPFLNAVIEVQTELEAESFLDLCLSVETQLGRVRTGGWSPRTIDVDLLLFGESRVETERLSLPHPRIAERDFVLQPLCDINPELKVSAQRVKVLLERLPVVDLEPYAGALC